VTLLLLRCVVLTTTTRARVGAQRVIAVNGYHGIENILIVSQKSILSSDPTMSRDKYGKANRWVRLRYHYRLIGFEIILGCSRLMRDSQGKVDWIRLELLMYYPDDSQA
jgi:hypothetical protein